MTKICAISDQHGHVDFKIPSCDLLIIAGDLCPAHDHSTVFQDYWLHNDFFTWLRQKDYKQCVFVGGNHDFALEQNRLRRDKFRRIRAYYIQDEWIELFGIKIYGTPWQLPFFDWAFNKPEEELVEIYKKIPNELDILISHGPPFQCLDKTIEGIFAGSKSLRKAIEDRQIKHCFTGHIHEQGSKQDLIRQTKVYNCSLLDEKYNMINQPFIIEI